MLFFSSLTDKHEELRYAAIDVAVAIGEVADLLATTFHLPARDARVIANRLQDAGDILANVCDYLRHLKEQYEHRN